MKIIFSVINMLLWSINDIGVRSAPSQWTCTLKNVMGETKGHHWLCKWMAIAMAMAGSVNLFSIILFDIDIGLHIDWHFCFRFTLIGMNVGICYQGEPVVHTSFLRSEVSTWIRNVAKPYDEKTICSTYSEWTQIQITSPVSWTF